MKQPKRDYYPPEDLQEFYKAAVERARKENSVFPKSSPARHLMQE